MIEGTDSEGTSFSVTKVQTFSISKTGTTGDTGPGTNFVFARQTAQPSTPTAAGLGIPSSDIQWYDDPPTTPLETLWSSKGTVAAGGSAYVWGAVFQPEGTAVAEIRIYSDVVASAGASPDVPGDNTSTFAMTTSVLTINDANWNASPPSVTNNGDTVYSCTALVSGSPTDTSVAVVWSDPTIFARKTDGADSSVAGPAGAGVVYRGEHSASTAYFGSATGAESNRRDVVKGTDNEYWIAKSDHTSLVNEDDKPITGTEATYKAKWEEFGASYSSVATDILFADDVYATRTVNVGTTEEGNAVISLFSDFDGTTDSGNPYIGIGATSFGAEGVWLGFEGGSAGSAGTAKFYIGSGSNDYLKYDGSNLSFKGANAELTTAGVLSATNLQVETLAQADYFNYRSININSTEVTGSYFINYSGSDFAPSVEYTALILDGSQGGDAAAFVRFDLAPEHPLGMIVAPGSKGGHQVTFEGNTILYVARARGISKASLSDQAVSQGKNALSGYTSNFNQDWTNSTFGFYSDADDIMGGTTNGVGGDSWWSYDVTLSGVAHENLARIGSGTRFQFTKSKYDFRMLAANNYNDFAPNFSKGIATNKLTVGDTALNNATYDLYVSASIGATGNVTAYISDERLKENIEPFVCGSAYLDKIRPVEFNWNEKAYEIGFKPDQHNELGFIAQELEEVLPQAVAPAPINKKDDDYLTVREEKLIPILVSSLKEQRSEISDLKEDMKDLKKIIKEL